MSFIYRLFFGSPSTTVENDHLWTFDFDDDGIIIQDEEGENVSQFVLEKVKEQFRNFDKLSKSICCLEDAKRYSQKKKVEILPEMPSAQENPYDTPFHAKESYIQNIWQKKFHFLNALNLGGRGNMALEKEITLPGGVQVSCSKQMMIDSLRWGHATFHIDNQEKSLPKDVYEQTLGKESLGFLKLLEEVYRYFQENKEILRRFSSYFHQGPFNDIFFTIQASIMDKYKFCLYQDQKEMTRGTHLVNKIHLILTMNGIFRYSLSPDGMVAEAPRGKNFGCFYGIVAINLKTQAATASLGAEVADLS